MADPEPRKIACPDCGRLLKYVMEESGLEARLVYLRLPEHPCNPAMLRFWNPESMHEPPFTR